jgi:hypothetical protein
MPRPLNGHARVSADPPVLRYRIRHSARFMSSISRYQVAYQCIISTRRIELYRIREAGLLDASNGDSKGV